MLRTKTVDVIFVTSAKNYIYPCQKISTIMESFYKDNFVRLPDENSILWENEFLLFKNFSQNLFGKCGSSKEVVGYCVAIIDRIVSNSNFVLKPNNSNRLLVGSFTLVNKHLNIQGLEYEKIFNLELSEIEKIEQEVYILTGKNIEIDKDFLHEYVESIYK